MIQKHSLNSQFPEVQIKSKIKDGSWWTKRQTCSKREEDGKQGRVGRRNEKGGGICCPRPIRREDCNHPHCKLGPVHGKICKPQTPTFPPAPKAMRFSLGHIILSPSRLLPVLPGQFPGRQTRSSHTVKQSRWNPPLVPGCWCLHSALAQGGVQDP